MREKLNSLPLTELREIAKANGLKKISLLRKEELINKILENVEEKKNENANEREIENKTVEVVENKSTYNIVNDNKSDDKKELTIDDLEKLDSGVVAHGILEVMPDGFGFIRCENYLPGENDVYVAPSQIRKFNLKTGDILLGKVRIRTQNEKFGALLYINEVNGFRSQVHIIGKILKI